MFAPPSAIGKNMIFWRKIVIFHTKYPKHFRASLHSAQFFLSTPPLAWNPGSAPARGHLLDKKQWSYKTGDLLKEGQFKWNILWQDKKNVTFKYRALLKRGHYTGRLGLYWLKEFRKKCMNSVFHRLIQVHWSEIIWKLE